MKAREQLGLIVAGVVALSLAAGLSGCALSPQHNEARRLKAGQQRMAQKDFVRAILEFRAASQAMPRDAEPQYQLGLAYLGSNNLGGAATAFRRALQLNPKDWRANLKLSEILARTRSAALVDDAAKRLHEILASSPDNAEALDTLAITEGEQGKTEEAAQRLEETFKKFPQHLQTAVVLARLKLTQKDFPGAEAVMQQAVANARQSAPAVLALAQLYLMSRHAEKAQAAAADAVRLEPNDPEALWTLAAAQILGKQIEQAGQTYVRIAALPDQRFRAAHALFLFHYGKPESAISELKQLVARYPEDEETRSRLVAMDLATNANSEAQGQLAEALRRNPKNTEALFQQSELALRTGNVDRAEADLLQVLETRPDSGVAHFLLATVQQAKGLDAVARQQLNEALKYDRGLLQARLSLARALVADNEPKTAIEVLDEAPEAQKGTLGVVAERNWALLATGDTKQLQASLDRALAVIRAPELVLQDAYLKLRQRDYTGARLAAEEVLQHNPEDVRAAAVVARSFAAQGQEPKAVSRLEELVQARPKAAGLRELLGEWYMALGKTAEARAAFETVTSEDPRVIRAELALAELDRREKHPEAALLRLTRIANSSPNDIRVVLALAGVQAQMGNIEGAIAGYQSALKIDKSNAFALNGLAYELAVQNPGDALNYAEQAVAIAPDNSDVEDTMGWVRYRQGDYSGALPYLKAAVDKDPTPRHQFHLGRCYLKTGDTDEAAKLLSEALQKDPTLPAHETGW